MSPTFLGECMVKISCTCAQNEIDQEFTYSWIDVPSENNRFLLFLQYKNVATHSLIPKSGACNVQLWVHVQEVVMQRGTDSTEEPARQLRTRHSASCLQVSFAHLLVLRAYL